jgi:hypothetical protein
VLVIEGIQTLLAILIYPPSSTQLHYQNLQAEYISHELVEGLCIPPKNFYCRENTLIRIYVKGSAFALVTRGSKIYLVFSDFLAFYVYLTLTQYSNGRDLSLCGGV